MSNYEKNDAISEDVLAVIEDLIPLKRHVLAKYFETVTDYFLNSGEEEQDRFGLIQAIEFIKMILSPEEIELFFACLNLPVKYSKETDSLLFITNSNPNPEVTKILFQELKKELIKVGREDDDEDEIDVPSDIRVIFMNLDATFNHDLIRQLKRLVSQLKMGQSAMDVFEVQKAMNILLNILPGHVLFRIFDHLEINYSYNNGIISFLDPFSVNTFEKINELNFAKDLLLALRYQHIGRLAGKIEEKIRQNSQVSELNISMFPEVKDGEMIGIGMVKKKGHNSAIFITDDGMTFEDEYLFKNYVGLKITLFKEGDGFKVLPVTSTVPSSERLLN